MAKSLTPKEALIAWAKANGCDAAAVCQGDGLQLQPRLSIAARQFGRDVRPAGPLYGGVRAGCGRAIDTDLSSEIDGYGTVASADALRRQSASSTAKVITDPLVNA